LELKFVIEVQEEGMGVEEEFMTSESCLKSLLVSYLGQR